MKWVKCIEKDIKIKDVFTEDELEYIFSEIEDKKLQHFINDIIELKEGDNNVWR